MFYVSKPPFKLPDHRMSMTTPIQDRPVWVHWLLFAVLPATLVCGVATWTIVGDAGVLARNDLENRLIEANRSLADLEQDNQNLLWTLRSIERDRRAMEREVVRELHLAPKGATVYQFTGDRPAPAKP